MKSIDEHVSAFVAGDRLGAQLGARFVSFDGTTCVYEYDARPEHFNPNGMLHGGALFTVMDSSQGLLVFYILDHEQAAATGTATIKYLAPVRAGRIVVRTTLARREGRKIFVTSEARSAEDRVVAVLEEVWITIPQDRPRV
jgi:uncharacterized protein (TIGR00369 family)